MPKRADVSLLFDFFVTSQRLRRVLSDAMAESGMRPDEYAVYSLLLEKGPLTATEMAGFLGMPLTTVLDYVNGRATQLSLNRSGVAAQKRANAYWEVVRKQIEEGLGLPIPAVRRALGALDDSADRAARRATRGRQPRVAGRFGSWSRS